jgi:hypothetical protein
MGYAAQVAGVQVQLLHDIVPGHRRQRIRGEVIGRLPASAILEVPRGIVQHRRLCVAVSRLVCEEGLCRQLSGGGEVLDGALCGEPGRDGDERIVLVRRQIRYPCRVGRYMISFLRLAPGCEEIGHVEYAVWVLVVVDALGGQGLDVAEDAVLERDRLVQRLELVVVIVDRSRVGKVNGEDTDALSSCKTTVSISSGQWAKLVCDVHMLGCSRTITQSR